jgi:hypothetical protein
MPLAPCIVVELAKLRGFVRSNEKKRRRNTERVEQGQCVFDLRRKAIVERQGKKGADVDVWVFQDHHEYDGPGRMADAEDVRNVAAHFGARYTERAAHSYVGNVYNIMEAYREAYATDARYVYLVEDDVIVAPDFFKWHESVNDARRWTFTDKLHRQPHYGDYWCSVAWHNIRNPETQATDDPHAIVESAVDYSSIGVCWPRENLAVIVRHARPEYYRDLTAYMAGTFPDSPIPPERWTEQAGLVMRELLAGNGSRIVAWSGRPRCAHIGIRGYHRLQGHEFTGPLLARVEALRRAIKTTGALVGKSVDPYDDVHALPQTLEWSAAGMCVAQRF